MTRAILLVTALLLALSPATSSAEVRYVRAGEDLQAALNAAKPGDELRLAPETTFSGNFVLPVTGGTSTITVRTDLPDASLPGVRRRVTPAIAARFAKLQSPNAGPALRTAPGAHHWRLMFLEFPSTKDGFGDILQLGDGSTAQSTLGQVPYEITLDRVYIHGHPLYGQKRGVALNARNVTIRDSYISDIKAVGIDAQAIGGWNGPGAFTIENNYLEASGEVILLGGADPAIPQLVSEGVSVRYNHMSRPMAWRDPIIPAPASVTATGGDGGTLSAGVYAYQVVARRPVGLGTIGSSMPSPEATAVASSGAVKIAWNAVADATEYQVFARAPSGATEAFTVPGTTFVHNGAGGGKAAAVPTSATVWTVKNIFELKNARRVTVEYNLMENNWRAGQPGYAVLFSPRNQEGACPWCVVEQVQFVHNVVRNVAGGFNISGYDSNGVSAQTNTITIADNLLYDVTTKLGGSGWAVLIGDAPRDIVIDHNTFDFDGTTLMFAYGGTNAAPKVMKGVRFTNNAARHGQYGINGDNASTGTVALQMYFPDIVFSGNWLSGGNASKYPPGNRFEEPFDPKLKAGSSAFGTGPGANVGRLLAVLHTITDGVMLGTPEPPGSPRD